MPNRSSALSPSDPFSGTGQAELQEAVQRLQPILADLGTQVQEPHKGPRSVLVISPEELGASPLGEEADDPLDDLADNGLLLVSAPGSVSDADLAEWRNRAWPRFHGIALYRLGPWGIHRESMAGRSRIVDTPQPALCVLALRRREYVLSPESTREKFDQNASGWNGEPGGPGYPHFRWMRRYVAEFANLAALRAQAKGQLAILDFGSGAGWVGIEAAKRLPGSRLDAFDPSPEMVKIAEANARQEGIMEFRGRVGFGEAPPFPAEGEPPYDLVLSSGVVSFSPDFERFMQGLTRGIKPGGTLVIGDIHPGSRGMRARRRERPLLPVRELNGVEPGPVEAWLKERGYRRESIAGYQLTFPMPQLMHFNEIRLKGILSRPLVWKNASATWLDRLLGHRMASNFDSWVMRFKAPGR